MMGPFEQALTGMKLGQRFRRQSWPVGAYAFVGQPNCIAAPHGILIVLSDQGINKDRMRPGLFRVDLDAGTSEAWLNTWVPTQQDVLATDWEVAPALEGTVPPELLGLKAGAGT